MKALSGHISQETAFIVDDYPYGFRLRTKIRYWIETRKGYGQRFCSQTLNPKTSQWNKPKAGNYHVIAVMTLDESNGHVSFDVLQSGGWSKEERIQEFQTAYDSAIGEYELQAIRYIRATNKANEMIKVTIHQAGYENGNPTNEPAQTREEQTAIWNAALRAGYSRLED